MSERDLKDDIMAERHLVCEYVTFWETQKHTFTPGNVQRRYVEGGLNAQVKVQKILTLAKSSIDGDF